jgi:cation diffusion facilitator CzcD-associated flavoprotein CzcO
VAIIGTGPYGLSLAAHLRATGVSFRIFGRPMEVWRHHMPKAMMLKSNGYASSLSAPDGGRSTLKAWARRHGRSYADRGEPVTLDAFLDYADWFRARHVPNLEETLVTQLEKAGDGFALTLDTGERLVAGQVVLAVGISCFAQMPPELAGLPPRFVSHSFDHRTVEQFAGREVVVLGAGASAVNLAYELGEVNAKVSLVARGDRFVYAAPPRPDAESWSQRLTNPPSPIGQGWRSLLVARLPGLFYRLPAYWRARGNRSHQHPAAGWFMRERIQASIPHLTGLKLVKAAVEDDRVRLTFANGEEMLCDHVCAATGYRTEVSRLGFVAEPLRLAMAQDGGMPALSPRFETKVRGLYTVGAMATGNFGPVLRFIVGSNYAAPRLAATLRQRVLWRRLHRALRSLYASGELASKDASAATIR